MKIQQINPNVKELHVFSDACGGQNRNNALVRFLLALASTGRFQKIDQYFPVRGHSFSQCDRNFGTAKRKIRRKDRIYMPDEYNDMVRTAKNTGFSVIDILPEKILDFKYWWPKYFKKSTKSVNKTETFSVSKYRHLQYSCSTPGYVIACEFIGDVIKNSFLLQKPRAAVTFPTDQAYSAKLPINDKKLEDLKKLLFYTPDDKKPFYDVMLTWPTSSHQDEDQSVDE